MSKIIIEIEISDDKYEELLDSAKKLQESYFAACGKIISADKIICMAAELGVNLHIKNNMDILLNAI